MEELNFNSPKPKDKEFTKYWNLHLPAIKDRENLKQSHLYQLSLLCDLCVELDQLKAVLREEGRTYVSFGRNGEQIKSRPEVAEKDKVITLIQSYSKSLGLVLVRDNKLTNVEKEANDFA